MEPVHLKENRYSYLVANWRAGRVGQYHAQAQEAAFERRVQDLFAQAQAHLHHEEYLLALDAFGELRSLILWTVHPRMPVGPRPIPGFKFPRDVAMIDSLAARAADLLRKAPVESVDLPDTLTLGESMLAGPVQQQLQAATQAGLRVTSYHARVTDQVTAAMNAAEDADWQLAAKHYSVALDSVPAGDTLLRATLSHDLALLTEKAGDRGRAAELGESSLKLFAQAQRPEAQVHALNTMIGVFGRAGKPEQATEAGKVAERLRQETVAVVLPQATRPASRPVTVFESRLSGRLGAQRLTDAATVLATRDADDAADTSGAVSSAAAPALMALHYVKAGAAAKTLTIRGTESTATIELTAQAASQTKTFLQTLGETVDLGLVTGFTQAPAQMVAYLPQMYFYVLPMSMADCLAGLGNFEEAEAHYLEALAYPFINKAYELPKLWVRLAQLYLDMADDAYRRARDDVAAFGAAKRLYERIVRTGGTLDAESPLYRDAKFASIKTRVTSFLAAADKLAFADNPAITAKVLEANAKLDQIAAGLNFFGFAPDYVPPFSFESLQNTARYFAQQAAQIEQRYIQYKSTAENEALRREQLDQQAEVARQSVVLEQRGLAEAQAGVAVAQASLHYADVQRQNAVESRQEFEAVRWELLEYAELEAWANASGVDKSDQVKLTISNYEHYGADSRRRNEVLKDLAGQRTRLSHDLEANRLQRALEAADAYRGIAQAQIGQAAARAAVAAQRIQLARLQQKQAEENRDFLDMKEFGSRLWFELAAQARRIKERYLDMATEVAFLMERAYNAETERGLRAIRYDYGRTASGNLMGADLLLADIDTFTFDHVTTTKTKKAPVKKVISLADSFVMPFQALKARGRCFFQTELAGFEREHPGLYLCKLRNVELVFVGLTGAASIAGTLRNIGVSRFRLEDGSVVARLYPSDVMPLSQYEIRQDALAFRFDPHDLRLFENNGIDTLWQLDLPKGANTFSYDELLDVHLVLYYDGLFSRTLEARVQAALPSSGAASRGFSLRMMFPDEMFFLKNQGSAEIAFTEDLFPRNQTARTRTRVTLKAAGDAATVGHLVLRLHSSVHGAPLVLTTDAHGEINASTPGDPLGALQGQAMLDRWTIEVTAADNPARVGNGALDLRGLADLVVFFEYGFDYA